MFAVMMHKTLFSRLDGKHVVFGQVQAENMGVVDAIEAVGSQSGKVSKEVIIDNCGQLS